LTTTDIELGSEAAAAVQAATQTVVDTGMATDVARMRRAAEAPVMPNFTLDVPPVDEEPAEADLKREASGEPARDLGTIDFQIELPPAGIPIHELPTVKDATSPGGGVDFKLEIPEGGLDLGSRPVPTTVHGVATTKDGHWYDVQTKFDLAKAYQEMGDKAGAKEILQEVINEGDVDQKSQAKALLDSLG
jgi:FimV-like protein